MSLHVLQPVSDQYRLPALVAVLPHLTMGKAMKKRAMKGAMKGKLAMSKGGIADALAAACEKKKSEMTKALDSLAELIQKEVKSTGKFKIPGVCLRVRPVAPVP